MVKRTACHLWATWWRITMHALSYLEQHVSRTGLVALQREPYTFQIPVCATTRRSVNIDVALLLNTRRSIPCSSERGFACCIFWVPPFHHPSIPYAG